MYHSHRYMVCVRSHFGSSRFCSRVLIAFCHAVPCVAFLFDGHLGGSFWRLATLRRATSMAAIWLRDWLPRPGSQVATGNDTSHSSSSSLCSSMCSSSSAFSYVALATVLGSSASLLASAAAARVFCSQRSCRVIWWRWATS